MLKPGFRSTIILLSIIAGLFDAANADDYQVNFMAGRGDDDGAMRRAEVVATLTPMDGKIGLTRSGADSGLYHQWATFVANIEVKDSAARPLDIIYEPHGVWRLPKWRNGEVTVRYTMLLQHDRFPNDPGDDELAYARPYGVMWTGRALFVEGAPSDQVTVAFEAPDAWKVTSPWRSIGADGLKFQPSDTDDLLDSAFFAGTHNETILNVAGIEARIATGPDMDRALDLYRSTLETYLSAYENLFDAATAASPVVIGARGAFWGGGVMGRSISMMNGSEVTEEIAPMVSYIVAHEAFHLWNAQWRYDEIARPPIEWIAEGAAEYYTKLIGVRSGDLQPDSLLAEFGDRWATYRNALGEKSIAAAGDTKLDDQASYDLVYSGGMMVSLALDLLIRQETNNTKTFDDAVRLIHQRYAQSNEGALNKKSLIKTIRDATGVDVSGFLTRHVTQQNPLPIRALLKNAGVCLTSQTVEGAWEASAVRCEDISPQEAALWSAWIEI